MLTIERPFYIVRLFYEESCAISSLSTGKSHQNARGNTHCRRGHCFCRRPGRPDDRTARDRITYEQDWDLRALRIQRAAAARYGGRREGDLPAAGRKTRADQPARVAASARGGGAATSAWPISMWTMRRPAAFSWCARFCTCIRWKVQMSAM